MGQPLLNLSDRERCYDVVFFKYIPVGGRFRFTSDILGWGCKTGLCEKISTRKYRYVGEQGEYTVGSVYAKTMKVNEKGEAIRHGEWSPSLKD